MGCPTPQPQGLRLSGAMISFQTPLKLRLEVHNRPQQTNVLSFRSLLLGQINDGAPCWNAPSAQKAAELLDSDPIRPPALSCGQTETIPHHRVGSPAAILCAAVADPCGGHGYTQNQCGGPFLSEVVRFVPPVSSNKKILKKYRTRLFVGHAVRYQIKSKN